MGSLSLTLVSRWAALLALGFLGFAARAADAPVTLQITPATVTLDGPESTQQMLVRLKSVDSLQTDRTHQARYQLRDPSVARISRTGLLEPLAEGATELVVSFGGQEQRIPVVVRGLAKPVPVSFERQIIPLLTKASCNSGGCHGKAEGQNGFKLSVFGFDPLADYRALVVESRGRRIMPAAPTRSLIVEKGTGAMPHGGGRKLVEGSLPYKRLVRWIAEGSQFQSEAVPPVVAIEVEPRQQRLPLGGTQQLQVTAVDAAGHRWCVTAEAEYESNNPAIAGVDRSGHVQAGQIPGEAAILVRYLGQVTVCRISIPRGGVQFIRPPSVNFIDDLVWNKLTELGIPPSELADDATFLRRVFLDVIGTLPTAAEARAFLKDTDPAKRSKLIDALLKRPEYGDFWALKWADLLRVDRDILTAPGAVAITRWLREQMLDNRPYDEFVREIVTAQGRITAVGPAGFFRTLNKPDVMSRSISQLFLGVRIECAECHHHPSDRWGQDDYYALASFFVDVGRQATPGGEMVIVKPGTDPKHPRTGELVRPRVLEAIPITLSEGLDRRTVLAEWMTGPKNPYFSRMIANRLWAHYFGRGLVDPIDDLRETNPASNEPLLEALAKHLVANKYDLHAFTRTLLNSRVYQLAGPTDANREDEQNFSHAAARRLPAEVLLDAISQTTGIPEKFNGLPEGVRAIQLWDNRMPSYFLKLFGRPARTSVCECERSGAPSIAQALHLMNAPEIQAKIHDRRGTAFQLANSSKSVEEIIDELCLGVLARFPTDAERSALRELFPNPNTGADRREATEDALWSLLNTKAFLFNH